MRPLSSAGLFTFGHLGPEVIRDMVSLYRPGAVAALGVNSIFFAEQGFGLFDGLQADGLITDVALHEVPIYDGPDEAHQDDTAMILGSTAL